MWARRRLCTVSGVDPDDDPPRSCTARDGVGRVDGWTSARSSTPSSVRRGWTSGVDASSLGSALRPSGLPGSPRRTCRSTSSRRQTAACCGAFRSALDRDELDITACVSRHAPRGCGVRGHKLARRSSVARGLAARASATTSARRRTWALLGGELRHPYDLTARDRGRVAEPGTSDRCCEPDCCAGRVRGVLRGPHGHRRRAASRGGRPPPSGGSTAKHVERSRSWTPDCRPVLDRRLRRRRRFIGCVDGAYPRRRIALEYEGDHHRTDTRSGT